jgi:hypothetical protein
MERLLARLERRLGRFAIPNLTYYLVGLTGLVFILSMARPQFLYALVFHPRLIVDHLQIWRAFTFLFIPRTNSVLWIVFELWFLWLVGNSLEGAWGAFKFNVYFFMGVLGTIAAAFALGTGTSSEFIYESLFLAFATLFPEYQILIFIFPVRAKWLGFLTAAILGWQAIAGGMVVRVAIGVAVANYLLFFGTHLWRHLVDAGSVAGRAKRRAEFLPETSDRPVRQCAICGKSDRDSGADLRVCTCQEVCGGKPTVYCLEHARSHNKPS